MDTAARTRLTYRYECLRAVAAGVLETAGATFLLLIAVRWFEAGPLAKGLVAAGSGLGYMLAPLAVNAVERARVPVSVGAARLALVGAAALGFAALMPTLLVFVLASVVAMAAAGAVIPLLTQVYQDNYPAASRGRYFSRTLMIRISSAAAFSWAGGEILGRDLAHPRELIVVFALAMAASAWCLARIPSAPLQPPDEPHPLRAFRTIGHDRLFRVTLTSWMFMGFANLIMLPLRVEYLANPIYGLALAPERIALLTGVVPNLARLVMSPLWGRLFDRGNFFVLRMCLNAGFALGIVSFFASDSLAGLIFSAITFGISSAGGDLAWSLWVTKVAPPARVADYMSVHTFLTGVRAVAAPLLAFALATRWPMTTMGWISAGTIGIATLMLLPDARRGNPFGAARAPITPPVPADEGEP
jgi:MFS family permease